MKKLVSQKGCCGVITENPHAVQALEKATRRKVCPDKAKRVTLIGLKAERQLELWAGDATGPMRHIKTYPVKAASGGSGPKLREGDRQVPEGIYAIESLNPNSRYHLALRVNYPNAFDRARAKEEKRTNLGGDIMIHGKAVSIGCLAMGDSAAEELFIVAAQTGVENVRVLLCPGDFRASGFAPPPNVPAWTSGLYRDLRNTLTKLLLKKYGINLYSVVTRFCFT